MSENKNDMAQSKSEQFVLKQAKSIKNFGIISLSILGGIILLIIIFAIAMVATVPVDPNASSNSWITTSAVLGILLLISIIIGSVCDIVFNIVAIIKIASTDWGNRNLNNNKLIFWILSLVFMFLLPIVSPILWIVWGNKVKNTIEFKTK